MFRERLEVDNAGSQEDPNRDAQRRGFTSPVLLPKTTGLLQGEECPTVFGFRLKLSKQMKKRMVLSCQAGHERRSADGQRGF